MFCPAGTALFHEFENATRNRADARDDVLRSHENRAECEEQLYVSKQRYSEALVCLVHPQVVLRGLPFNLSTARSGAIRFCISPSLLRCSGNLYPSRNRTLAYSRSRKTQ